MEALQRNLLFFKQYRHLLFEGCLSSKAWSHRIDTASIPRCQYNKDDRIVDIMTLGRL